MKEHLLVLLVTPAAGTVSALLLVTVTLLTPTFLVVVLAATFATAATMASLWVSRTQSTTIVYTTTARSVWMLS